jgi:hypothetical protein
MIPAVLLCASLLGAPASDPQAPTAKRDIEARLDDVAAETLAKYNELREKATETATSQWNLALWCEKTGLTAEAYSHFAAVVRLDPSREAAWKRLGFKKLHGRWMNEDEQADEAEQAKADKTWAPQLKKIHKEIHRGPRQEEAQKALDAIEDARAVVPIYHEFGNGGATDQLIAIEALGRIATPLSSKLMALMSVYGRSPEVRRRAAESLRARDADDYLGVLVALLSDALKYEVRPVSGAGSPGVLFVEGSRFNLRRVYAAPAPPNVAPRPGDIISYDNFGQPVIERPNGLFLGSKRLTGTTKGGGLDANLTSVTIYSPSQAMAEAQRAAASSQAQLQNDVAEIDTLNEQRKRFNELVIAVARNATGKALGNNPQEWREALPDKAGSAKTLARSPVKPTFDELVAPAYRPSFGGQLAFASYLTARAPDN